MYSNPCLQACLAVLKYGGIYDEKVFCKGGSYSCCCWFDRKIHRGTLPDSHGEYHRIHWYELLPDGLSLLFVLTDCFHSWDSDSHFQAGCREYRYEKLSVCPQGFYLVCQ